MWLKRHSLIAQSTTLHPSKDLAVSLPHYGGIILKINLEDPSPFGLGVTARTSMVTHDGRYPLPSCCLHSECSDFPHHSCEWREYSTQGILIMQQNNNFARLNSCNGHMCYFTMRIPNSMSCSGVAVEGAAIMRSLPSPVFAKAMTSRMFGSF